MSWPWESKAAVDARFYAQQMTAFTLTRSDTWSGHGFKVTGVFGDNKAKLQVKTAHLGNGHLRSLLFLDADSQGTLLAVEESRFGITGQQRWEAFRDRDMTATDLLFVAVDKTQFFQMGNTVQVFLNTNSSGERVPDFVVHGSYWGAMTVSRGGDGGDFVAQIQNESRWWSKLVGLGENRYTVWIEQDVDQAFLLALTVILDQMHSPRPGIAFCNWNSNANRV